MKAYLSDVGFDVTESGFPENDSIVGQRDVNGFHQELIIDLDLFNKDGTIKEIKDKKALEKAITFTSKFKTPDVDDLPF